MDMSSGRRSPLRCSLAKAQDYVSPSYSRTGSPDCYQAEKELVHVPEQCLSRILLVLPRSFVTEGQVVVETVVEQQVPLVQADVADHD